MKLRQLLKTLLGVAIWVSLSGCDNSAGFVIHNPEGTDTITLKNDSSNVLPLGDYKMTMDNCNKFFVQDGNAAFVCFGEKEYLVEIDSLVPSGWREEIAALPHYGYAVRLGDNGEDGYARILVNTYTENEMEISGALLLYQYPWHPVNEETIVFAEESLPSGGDDPYTDDQDKYWNNSTWHFTGEMSCDGNGIQEFDITFIDVKKKTYRSNLDECPWLATSLTWEDYKGWRITLRGYDDGGHTSFDFDISARNSVNCEYHHWDRNDNFCKANFVGTRRK